MSHPRPLRHMDARLRGNDGPEESSFWTAGMSGRTILVTHEEGFGDTLHFLRYVPMLQARGARVLIAVPNELRRLLADTAEILAPGDMLPNFDFHCPFFSLPRAFGTTLETIPAAVPYLHPNPSLVAQWAHRLPQGGMQTRMRVGLVWAGQARPWLTGFTTLDRRRSAGLDAFAPLAAVQHVQFICLQKGEPAAQARTPPPGLTLHDPMAEATDFADTAAIIANLDLVISVDTAVVHLAGAMGKPVFLLDRYDNCWRWFTGRNDSPWYPTLRIFRQERMGDWEAPMRRIVTALQKSPLPLREGALQQSPSPCGRGRNQSRLPLEQKFQSAAIATTAKLGPAKARRGGKQSISLVGTPRKFQIET